METAIEEAEDRKSAIEAELVEFASDFERVGNLYTELEALTSQLEVNVERWSELAERA